jgi:hypothetical protein
MMQADASSKLATGPNPKPRRNPMAQAHYVTSAIRAPITDAGAKPSANPLQASYAEFLAALAGHPPHPIPVYADATDLDGRADHLSKVLDALSAYLTTILTDTAQNVPGGLDLRQADALLSDLASEATGTIRYAADTMAEEVV